MNMLKYFTLGSQYTLGYSHMTNKLHDLFPKVGDVWINRKNWTVYHLDKPGECVNGYWCNGKGIFVTEKYLITKCELLERPKIWRKVKLLDKG